MIARHSLPLKVLFHCGLKVTDEWFHVSLMSNVKNWILKIKTKFRRGQREAIPQGQREAIPQRQGEAIPQ